jgi:hypothetical protein
MTFPNKITNNLNSKKLNSYNQARWAIKPQKNWYAVGTSFHRAMSSVGNGHCAGSEIDRRLPGKHSRWFSPKSKKHRGRSHSAFLFPQLLTAKKFKRNRDESYKPLSKYPEEELEKMCINFFDDDRGYDYKRYCFVYRINPDDKIDGIGDKDLFSARRKIWRRRKYEKLFYEA